MKNERFYTHEGEELPSVTTVTGVIDKPFLRYWYGKHGTATCLRIAEESTTLGKLLHTYIDDYFSGAVRGILPSQDPKFRQCVVNFHKFVDKYKPIRIDGEKILYGDGYAGTRDWRGKVKDDKKVKRIIIDWKSSNAIDGEEYELQLEAYYRAEPDDIQECWVVRLPKDEEINFKKDIIKYKPKLKTYNAFKNLLGFFNWRMERRKIPYVAV